MDETKILKPSFFILGVQKGGTSTLHKYLSESNEIYMSEPKEIHYYDMFYEKGIEWYLNHFVINKNQNYKIAGESTPYYFFHPKVPKRLKKDFPYAKFIVLLRNPIERAYSHYQMSVRRGLEKRSFENAIKKERIRILFQSIKIYFNNRLNIIHAEKSYISRGYYSKQIKRWLRYFNEEQFLFLKSEDLFQDPNMIIRQITRFLNISNEFEITPIIENKGDYEKLIKTNTKKKLQKIFKREIFLWNNLQEK